jgi:hypothetical protein
LKLLGLRYVLSRPDSAAPIGRNLCHIIRDRGDDGQRFVVNVAATDVRPSLEFILNWGQTQGRR